MGAEKLHKNLIQEFEESLIDTHKGTVNLFTSDEKPTGGIFAKNIFVGESVPPGEVIKCLLKNMCRHFIQKDSNKSDLEINFAAKVLNDSGCIFDEPVKILLDPCNTEAVSRESSMPFSSLDQKMELLDKVKEVLEGSRDTIVADAVAVADELITNAVYHSAIESSGNRPIHLVSKEAQFCVARTENELLIMCSDPNGTLDPRKLLEKISECYENDVESQINQGSGGAGIGSYMVHQIGCSYTVAVDPGNKTLIGVKLPLNMSNRKRSELSKNLHIIIKETT